MKLANIDLFNPDTFVSGVPHDVFKLLRAEAPVFWHKEPRPGFWAVSKYADVVSVSKDPATFSSARKGTQIIDPPEEDMVGVRLMMLNMDPPRHVRYRRLVSRGFTPRMIQRLEPHIREITTRIIDRVAAKEL